MLTFMKERHQKKVRFGIGSMLSLAIGVVSVIIAILSFGIATHFNKAMIVANAMDKDWSVAVDLVGHLTEKDIAALLEAGRAVYESLPEEERTDPKDKTYQSRYDVIKDADYPVMLDKLDQSVYVPGAMWGDLRFKDEERGRYVVVMSLEEKADGTYGTGYWEDVNDPDNFTYEVLRLDEASGERMEFLPQWTGRLPEQLPEPVRYFPHVIDHLLLISQQDIEERFCVLYPIESPSSGEVVGYLSVGEYYTNYETYNSAFAFVFAGVMVPYCIVVVFLLRLLADRSIARPIQRLAEAAVAYGKDEDRQKDGGYFKSIPVPYENEVLMLRDSMADMEDNLIRYMDNLKQMTAKQERYNAEMDMSASIQMGMLPKALGDGGRKQNFAITASIRPARSVSGDFYDFFEIDDERTGIVIADVSGKGMPAALFMMIAKVILSTVAKSGVSVAEAMRRTNLLLCDNNPETLFVTACFGIYHAASRTLTYVNAGHNYPAMYRHGEGKFTLVEEENDFPAGFNEQAEYTERMLVFAPGDKLFLYTDGIPEAHNASDELYGDERMLSALNNSASCSREAFLEAVRADVSSFIGQAEQFDDMTMLLLEFSQ